MLPGTPGPRTGAAEHRGTRAAARSPRAPDLRSVRPRRIAPAESRSVGRGRGHLRVARPADRSVRAVPLVLREPETDQGRRDPRRPRHVPRRRRPASRDVDLRRLRPAEPRVRPAGRPALGGRVRQSELPEPERRTSSASPARCRLRRPDLGTARGARSAACGGVAGRGSTGDARVMREIAGRRVAPRVSGRRAPRRTGSWAWAAS